MSNTFNAFVKFISDDPIMLGLCIAIIVLIIAFILVLFLGRKKDDKEECIADNTTELLKTEINMDTLKSTQEFSISQLQAESPIEDFETSPEATPDAPAMDIPITETKPSFDAVEVPITLEDAPVSLEIPDKATTSTLDSEIPTMDSVKIEEPKIETPSIDIPTPESIYNSNIFDLSAKEAPAVEPAIEPVPLDEPTVAPIIESTVNPVEPTAIPSFESVFGVPSSQPQEPVIPVVPIEPKIEAPFSSVNVDPNAELPNMNFEDFSRTEIIKHIPVMDVTPAVQEPVGENDDEDLDDVELPMLNTNVKNETSTNALNIIQGESFNI